MRRRTFLQSLLALLAALLGLGTHSEAVAAIRINARRILRRHRRHRRRHRRKKRKKGKGKAKAKALPKGKK